ncbi:hypothetical protein ERHA54_43700 [Erwinia rhapontici]|uniref:Uncharacterized protein n=1 Tax=Erwinia rhapontici TaxID=55212 RepID=A0ABM7N5Q1_ERWRD|nr:hypothetical protein [Erwinia rhapontici]MCS3608216.1 hypothetical protein [Erwinia rhapontici]TDT00687.1 hypothetical protein EDF84_102419 [Erwinia rhapontici]BCQ36763.1 hypothetical protein ERHA53_41060 [Erwinia rhapontici]BCQ41767.1 hypothetical protein ERHA54_43700 [Erwinia rhapontici]
MVQKNKAAFKEGGLYSVNHRKIGNYSASRSSQSPLVIRFLPVTAR